jgi:DNA invertase Pin-like site-specific DNA recombinase
MHKNRSVENQWLLLCRCYVQKEGKDDHRICTGLEGWIDLSFVTVRAPRRRRRYGVRLLNALETQQAKLKEAGAEKAYAEKMPGAVTDRKALAKAMASLEPGDTLFVCRLDRLARSTRDLLNVLASVSEKGAGFRSLADPMIDTTSPHGKLIIAVFGALAEFERSMIVARTSEGRARAQARGIRFGRKPKLTPHQIAEALARRDAGEPFAEIGRSYNVSHSTISRLGVSCVLGACRQRAKKTVCT